MYGRTNVHASLLLLERGLAGSHVKSEANLRQQLNSGSELRAGASTATYSVEAVFLCLDLRWEGLDALIAQRLNVCKQKQTRSTRAHRMQAQKALPSSSLLRISAGSPVRAASFMSVKRFSRSFARVRHCCSCPSCSRRRSAMLCLVSLALRRFATAGSSSLRDVRVSAND